MQSLFRTTDNDIVPGRLALACALASLLGMALVVGTGERLTLTFLAALLVVAGWLFRKLNREQGQLAALEALVSGSRGTSGHRRGHLRLVRGTSASAGSSRGS